VPTSDGQRGRHCVWHTLLKELAATQTPVYTDLEGAAKAIAKVSQYFVWQAGSNED